MALVNKPDESIFASSAKQGEVDNFPDLLRGWGITFDQTQGIPPMEWFNFLFKRLDEKHTYLMQRGLPEWSATQDYTKGSCVQFDGVSYRALKNSKNNIPNESDSQYWVRWGFTLSEIARATLTQYGVTQLYTGYDSQSEDLALTPKTAYQLKQLIDSNTRSLSNFIPNSKKSNAVNSNSADTVATSAAVKTAYDLANGKQSPATTLAGYGIGNFKIENFVGNVNTLQTDGIYAVAQASRSQNLPVAGNGCHIQVIAGGDGRWCRQIAYIAYSTDVYERHQTSYQTDSWSDWVKIDSLDKIPNSKKSSEVDSNSTDTVATSAAVKSANDNANGRVSKLGDTMTGSLAITGSQSGGFANGLMLKNKAGGQNTGVFVDFFQSDNIPRASMWMRDAGNNSTQIEFLNTPEGADWNRDSRQGVFTITSAGSLWCKSYGWIHEQFASKSEVYAKSRFRHQYYPNHYEGAEVFDVPMGDNGVMRTIVMGATIDGYAKLNLPESFNGNCRVQVMDVGNGRHAVGANIQNGNVVEVFNYGHTGLNIIATGWYGW